MQTYDIIIVGGGITGLSLACMLAQKTSLSIAILEARSLDAIQLSSSYHHRVSALTLSSERLFKNLHIWDELTQHRVAPFKQIEIWDAQTKAEIQFDSREIAEPRLGHIVENNLLQFVLMNKVKEFSQIKYAAPVTLQTLAEKENHIELMTDGQEIFQAKLIVGADGALSWVREQAGIPIQRTSYQQSAIVANVQTTLPHQDIARQVFLPDGPLAFLPLADPQWSSIVWSTSLDKEKMLMTTAVDEFKKCLANNFEHCLGNMEECGPRFSFPLSRHHANAYVKHRLALVGDAAHTVHPMAGQGVNMGLLDAASLVDVVVEALHQQRNFASFSTLRRYERWRKADNLVMETAIDWLHALFGNQKKPVPALRKTGLNIINNVSFIKNQFTRYAAGSRGDLPLFCFSQ